MNTNQLPKIKFLFSRVLFISAIFQIILLILLTWCGQNFYKSNKNDILKKDLLIVDNITASEIAKYILLNNNYAINLTLMALQQKSKIDNIELTQSLNNVSLKNCNINKHTPIICNNKNVFFGIIPINIANEFYGFIMTKKFYNNDFFDTSMKMAAILAVILIILIITMNYFLILISVKRYINNNINNLAKIISGSNVIDHFNTNDFKLIANYIIQERETIEKLQKALTKKKLHEAIYKISASVAHDLNNPINGVKMIMPKIKNNMVESPELKLLDIYINQIQLIASDILKYFRENTSEKTIENNLNFSKFIILEDIISSIIQNNKQWKCNIEFLNNEYSWINLVPIQLQRVLTNLLNNAYESLSNSIKNITIKITLKDTMIELIIEDTGYGIPEDQLANVLQGKSLKHIGKGLGLSSAVEYFKEIGGSLAIESKQNIGTKIIITIPQSIPSWFTNKIQYTEDTIFMVLEDSISNLSYWQKLFIITDNKKLYFADLDSFKESIENNILENVILITNYTLYKKLLEENITNISNIPIIFIVYDDINQCEVQTIIKNSNCRLIPHSLLEKIILEESYMS